MPKIIVKSTVDGFRRGGHAFNREGVTLDTRKLTEAQLAAIKAEPKLVVSEIHDAPAKTGKPATSGNPDKTAGDSSAGETGAAANADTKPDKGSKPAADAKSGKGGK